MSKKEKIIKVLVGGLIGVIVGVFVVKGLFEVLLVGMIGGAVGMFVGDIIELPSLKTKGEE